MAPTSYLNRAKSDADGGVDLRDDLSSLSLEPVTSIYWARFPGFRHNPLAPLSEEFERLSSHMCWSKTSKKQRKRRAECYSSEFETHFGTTGNNLEVWQDLCAEVGIEPAPISITQCKKALKNVYVNLVNLMDHRRNNKNPVLKFDSYNSFRKYTMNGHIFPKGSAKADGFLHILLRVVK